LKDFKHHPKPICFIEKCAGTPIFYFEYCVRESVKHGRKYAFFNMQSLTYKKYYFLLYCYLRMRNNKKICKKNFLKIINENNFNYYHYYELSEFFLSDKEKKYRNLFREKNLKDIFAKAFYASELKKYNSYKIKEIEKILYSAL